MEYKNIELLKENEVLVRMLVRPINPSDLIPVTGAYAHRIPLPNIPGYEGVGIVVYVIGRLKNKYDNGTLGKKKSKNAQVLLDSLIPIGMLLGCIIGLIFGMFFPDYSLLAVSLEAAIGYLFGFFAYEFYSKAGNNYS
ncbi:alcohol dehydrogenase catalytic domain-containing protein [Bacillus wiedmannii]|uniref:alcohol dehydrogenase catalytic domain-containing protein n=1 Tax=Bacillus wiedmannii TaxID=1890302 RepID=UPI0039FC8550